MGLSLSTDHNLRHCSKVWTGNALFQDVCESRMRFDRGAVAVTKEVSDYELGNDLAEQEKLLVSAFATGENDVIEQALIRVKTVRRMKSNGTLDWQRADFKED